MFHKVKMLRAVCEVSRARCEMMIIQYSREEQVLLQSEASISVQINGLRQILKTLRTESTVMCSEQLRNILRKESVLRRKIQDFEMQLLQLKEQHEVLLKKILEQKNKRGDFLRKEENYKRRLFYQKKVMQRLEMHKDELEQEDRR